MLSAAQTKMKERLAGSRFRMLNEEMYIKKSDEIVKKFSEDSSLFEAYHKGYRQQVAQWPVQPLSVVERWIKHHIVNGSRVGDFGCGEASLAKRLRNVFHVSSFDMVAANRSVVACNIASIPLPNCSLDVAVYCLSLMGSDWPEFIGEAHRLLVHNGWLLIAEVSSRFTDKQEFIDQLSSVGFEIHLQENYDTYFDFFAFRKTKSNEPLPSSSSSSSSRFVSRGVFPQHKQVLRRMIRFCRIINRRQNEIHKHQQRQNEMHKHQKRRITDKVSIDSRLLRACVYKRR